jgi:hypothetical protein
METPTLLGPLERANLNHCCDYVSPSPHLKTETDPISETNLSHFTEAQQSVSPVT